MLLATNAIPGMYVVGGAWLPRTAAPGEATVTVVVPQTALARVTRCSHSLACNFGVPAYGRFHWIIYRRVTASQ